MSDWPPAGITPYYWDDWTCIVHGECREILPRLPKALFLLTDPPYGAKTQVDNTRFSDGRRTGPGREFVQPRRPIVGDDRPFDPAPLLRFRRKVLWGANYYASRLPDSGGWIVWDKRQGIEDTEWPLSEAELAWTNLGAGVRIFRHRWFGLVRESERGEHYHPTQKPVALMRWILERWNTPGEIVLDPYMGSGPVLVAAKAGGRRAIGIEIERDYCDIAITRLRQESLFSPPTLPKGCHTTVPTLFDTAPTQAENGSTRCLL